MSPNPYADYGVVVTRPRLVGRTEEIERISLGIKSGRGSAALVGEPRVGKSSMANAVLEELAKSVDIQTGWIDLGSADPDRGLVAELASEIRGTDANEPAGDDESRHALLKRTLRSDRREGIWHFVVIDEFDAIRGMRRADLDARRLRELIYRPHDYGLSVLLVSRRRIGLLEQSIPNLSTLDGVCRTYFVKPLTRLGIRQMIARGWPTGIPGEAEVRIWEWLGGHPYLTEAFLCALSEVGDIEDAEGEVRDLVRKYFDRLSQVLVEDGAVLAAMDIAAGRLPASSDALHVLTQYGVLVQSDEGARLFAKAFRDYLAEQPAMPEAAWATELRT